MRQLKLYIAHIMCLLDNTDLDQVLSFYGLRRGHNWQKWLCVKELATKPENLSSHGIHMGDGEH